MCVCVQVYLVFVSRSIHSNFLTKWWALNTQLKLKWENKTKRDNDNDDGGGGGDTKWEREKKKWVLIVSFAIYELFLCDRCDCARARIHLRSRWTTGEWLSIFVPTRRAYLWKCEAHKTLGNRFLCLWTKNLFSTFSNKNCIKRICLHCTALMHWRRARVYIR